MNQKNKTINVADFFSDATNSTLRKAIRMLYFLPEAYKHQKRSAMYKSKCHTLGFFRKEVPLLLPQMRSRPPEIKVAQRQQHAE